ncbi:hypothetical protein K440DRAFT_640166 [Wilcoxina mikolae CBS 423.85]|nr:hypothetical protein K440DRAFT_640166 [Wilcoxina mikolae CBS 423.85]
MTPNPADGMSSFDACLQFRFTNLASRQSEEYYYSFSVSAGGLVRDRKVSDPPLPLPVAVPQPMPQIFTKPPFCWIIKAWNEGWILPIWIAILAAVFFGTLIVCIKFVGTYYG